MTSAHVPSLDLPRRCVAEALGSAFLLLAIVGSGIMGERLARGDLALTLLANSLATGAALGALILALGGISGAHFNPLVTLVAAGRGALPPSAVPATLAAQFAGALLGVTLADALFGEPFLAFSQHARNGVGQWSSEGLATFGLLTIVLGTARQTPLVGALSVAGYVGAAYWFTASTAFANPAVTLARATTDTFAGIRPTDVPGFWIAQSAGAWVAHVLHRWLIPPTRDLVPVGDGSAVPREPDSACSHGE